MPIPATLHSPQQWVPLPHLASVASLCRQWSVYRPPNIIAHIVSDLRKQTVALTCCPDSLIATVSGLGMSVRTLGGAIGTTVYSAIYQNKLAKNLPTQIAKHAIEAGLPILSAPDFVAEFLETRGNVSLTGNITAKILSQAALGEAWGYDLSFKYVWIASVAFGGVACVLCCFIPNTQKHLTNRVAVVRSSPILSARREHSHSRQSYRKGSIETDRVPGLIFARTPRTRGHGPQLCAMRWWIRVPEELLLYK